MHGQQNIKFSALAVSRYCHVRGCLLTIFRTKCVGLIYDYISIRFHVRDPVGQLFDVNLNGVLIHPLVNISIDNANKGTNITLYSLMYNPLTCLDLL